jgi:hypothetical protein
MATTGGRPKRLQTAVLVMLIAGAVLFVLLLSGVGAGVLTNPR